MRSLIVYSVLVAFSFLSLTPAGVSLAELRADDDLELDELDLGLEDEEEDEEDNKSDKKKAKSDESDEDEEDEESEEEDVKKSEKDDEAEDSEDSESEEDEDEVPAAKKSAKSEDSEEETSASNGKKIVAFYFFEDSHTLKSASHVVTETAKQLEESSDYDYVETEAGLFTVASTAKSDMKRIKKDFEAGKALYAEDNQEDAIEKFQSVLKYLEDNIDTVADMKLFSDVLFYLGASNKLLDEDRQAENYFKAYISINPDGQPDESEFVSEVVSAFNSVKNNLGKTAKGSVRVASNPDGALIFIDGKIAGITPTILRGVSNGKHYYRIHKNGYRDAGGTIEVKEGRTASISETITKYSQAAPMFEAEKEIKSDFGQAAMFSKSMEIAKDLNVSNVLVVKAKLGADERLNYTGYMIDREKREYKKSEAVLDLPEKGAAADSASLKEFNKALINDPYEYKSISDVFAAEVDLLASDGNEEAEKNDKKEKKPVYKEWWLWTVVGVVVLAGAGVGTYFAVTANKGGGDDGATLKINFK